MRRLRQLAPIVLASLAATALVACSESGGDEDPAEVLRAIFENDQEINSGVFEMSFNVTAEGGENAGELEASIGGPFQGGGEGVPSFDITAEANLDSSAQDFSGSIGLVSTGSSAFVEFQDDNYQVPQRAFDQFARSFTQLQDQSQQQGEGGNTLLGSLGIDPTNWLTDLENEGEEEVDGTDTTHISGEAEVPRLVEDLKQIVENTPQAADRLTPGQLGQLDELTEIVESASVDVYGGTDDDVLRRFDANLELKPPGDDPGTPESVNVEFSINLNELNESQEIAAPTGARPLGELLQQLGVDPSQLGDLGGALGAADGGGGVPQAGGSPGGPSDGASQAYLDCLAEAQGAAAVQQCAELLQQ